MSWALDYRQFVKAVVVCHSSGVDEKQLSEEFADSVVEWSGKIESLELDHEYAKGIRLVMDVEVSIISSGLKFSATHLFLGVEPDENSWQNAEVGETIRFQCYIPNGNGPFSSVKVVEFSTEREAYLELTTQKGKRIGAI